MTEYQKYIIKNMDNETLMENYRYFTIKVHGNFEFKYLDFMTAISDEVMRRMSK